MNKTLRLWNLWALWAPWSGSFIALFLCFNTPIAIGATTHRLALVMGANDGGPTRTKLRFANSDAQTFAGVLRDLGGVAPEDAVVITDSTVKSLKQGMTELRRKLARLASEHQRLEVIVYYSGHSNEEGLLLGREVFTYHQLKTAIAALPADVRVTVLDACESGTMTASKGGKRRPSFLMDESTKARGQAIITSSSSDEAAQESASVAGSFFTHYLVSGMRGAADVNTDGKVTLNEAYQYAYIETLARTERTKAGAQHPAYDFKLAGTGDLTLTDVREASATLMLPPKLEGRYFVRNDKGQLVAEINKPAGRGMELGLVPGSYGLVVERDKQRFEGEFLLDAKTKVSADSLHLAKISTEENQTRGDEIAEGVKNDQKSEAKQYKEIGLHVDLVPSFDEMDEEAKHESHRFAFGILGGRSAKVNGFAMGFLGYWVDDGVDGVMLNLGISYTDGYLHGAQLSTFGNYVGGEMSGFQGAAIANYASGPVSGVQAASIANIARSDLVGFQGAAVANITTGTITGVQASAAVNYVESISGAQLGIVNVTKTSVVGVQAGIVNYARRFKGLQIGIVNISEEADGVPIGIVSYVKNGRKDLDLWVDELGMGHLSYKMGTKNFYTVYDLAGRQGGSGIKRLGGLGFGGMTDVVTGSGFYLFGDMIFSQALEDRREDTGRWQEDSKTKKTDALTEDERRDYQNLYVLRMQIAAGYRLGAGASVFVGPSYAMTNVQSERFEDVIAPRLSGQYHKHARGADWMGGIVGTKYEW